MIELILLNPACDQLQPVGRAWVDCNLQVKNNQSAFIVRILYFSTFSVISPIQSQLVSDAQEVEGLIGKIRKRNRLNRDGKSRVQFDTNFAIRSTSS